MGTVNLWPSTISRTEIFLYGAALRKLLRLPVRKGNIVAASWENGRLKVTFEITRSKKLTIHY